MKAKECGSKIQARLGPQTAVTLTCGLPKGHRDEWCRISQESPAVTGENLMSEKPERILHISYRWKKK